MSLSIAFVVLLAGADAPGKILVKGLTNPESAVVSPGGKTYVSEIGAFDKAGDGRILVLDDQGQATPFATGLDDPKGMAFWNKTLFVSDVTKVLKIDETGKAIVFAAKEAFPRPPIFLNDVAVDPEGVVYVSDTGSDDKPGAVFRIDQRGKVSLVVDSEKVPGLKRPNGVLLDGVSHLLVVDFVGGELYRVRIKDAVAEKVADGFAGGDGLAWDLFGRLYVSSWTQGKVWGIARAGAKPVLVASGFQSAADLCVDATGKSLSIPDMKAGTLVAVSSVIPTQEVDESPLPIVSVPAFAKLKWAGWERVSEDGKPRELRPLFLTHAGDGSGRNFAIEQSGTIHVFPNRDDAAETKIFLDIVKNVFYSDRENEQGLLGLAFHPKFKENGEFFVYYSLKSTRLTNVVSRFKVSKDDPNKADPASEEEIFRISRPFWNHDGGTIEFGPDGFLYIVLGDGGAANDPFRNGQNLKALLGKILRVDVDRRDEGKKYAIPKDNPFVGNSKAAPEIWAYGLRNPWRIAFDRATGDLWCGDVGQNLYEEIDLIVKGGNYGWNVRESFHPFGDKGVGPRADLIDPIWEYHHDLGKSITGGLVYRGKRLPELVGSYIYGDYTSSRIWALKYDAAQKRTVANRPLGSTNQPIVSFGEDENGEIYYMAPTMSGQGIYRFERKPQP